MKKISFTSIKYSDSAFNIALLLLRVSFGMILMVKHGFAKVMHFAELQNTFYNFLGLGHKFSLILALFAEIFCSLMVVLGLFTRYACIPVVFTMLIIIYSVDAQKDFLESELAIFILTAFAAIMFLGPGKISVDGMINK